MTARSRLDRVGALSGAVYVVLILIGNTMTSTGNENVTHPTGQQVLTSLDEMASSQVIAAGLALELVGFVAFAVFLGWIAQTFRASTGPASWLGHVAVISGVMTLAVKLSSYAPMGTAILDRDQLSPAMARVLYDMNSASFFITFLTTGMFIAAMSWAFLAGQMVARPYGWTGLLIGVSGIAVALVADVDFLSANFLPFLLGLVWTLAVSIRLTIRPVLATAGPTTVVAVGAAH